MITPLPGITSTKPGSATQPFPGIQAEVVDEREGKPIDEGQGLLVLKRPWPSMLRTLYKEDERFIETYFTRFGNETYLVGDAARKDKDGYFWVIGRIDDVVNVSGHRLSTAEVESAIVAHDVGRRGRRHRPVRRADRPGDLRVRHAPGRHRGHRRGRRGNPRHRRRADRQVRAAQADHLGRRPAEDPLRQDHAPPAARHRRRPGARRRHDAARPGRDGRSSRTRSRPSSLRRTERDALWCADVGTPEAGPAAPPRLGWGRGCPAGATLRVAPAPGTGGRRPNSGAQAGMMLRGVRAPRS